jgi:signal transduction histidine kinase
MRRTIPQFGRLGAALAAVTSPLATETTNDLLWLLGVSLAALAISIVVAWRGLIERVSHGVILGLLMAYCVLIALAIVLTGDPASPYGLFYVLPVLFTAVFFEGWLRYSTAVVAPFLDYVVVGTFLDVGITDRVLRLGLLVLLAHFGAVVAATLREALRANRSLHTVLEAASGAPLDDHLAAIGVDAALSVAGWDAGGVALVAEDRIDLPALRGVSPSLTRHYLDHPEELAGGVVLRSVLDTGGVAQLGDVADLGPDHPLVREGLVSLAGMPISFRGEVIGALLVGHRSPRRLDDRELDRLRRVTDQLGLALGSAAAYRRETQVAEHLRELNRRKDEFLANVSHELRTPAAAIKIVAATLQNSGDRLEDDVRMDMYDVLQRRSEHLIDLISDLLDEALADAGATRLVVEPIDWKAALRRWAELAELQTGRPVTLELPDEEVHGTGDAVKLERVAINLLSNAAKFSPADTPITVRLVTRTSSIRIEVRDEGIGIAPEEADRIFERFHQVDGGPTRASGGFGIGLSLARHFVLAHAGDLHVESRPGEGATFIVELPLRAEAVVR